jgi:hypothetical protein
MARPFFNKTSEYKNIVLNLDANLLQLKHCHANHFFIHGLVSAHDHEYLYLYLFTLILTPSQPLELDTSESKWKVP